MSWLPPHPRHCWWWHSECGHSGPMRLGRMCCRILCHKLQGKLHCVRQTSDVQFAVMTMHAVKRICTPLTVQYTWHLLKG